MLHTHTHTRTYTENHKHTHAQACTYTNTHRLTQTTRLIHHTLGQKGYRLPALPPEVFQTARCPGRVTCHSCLPSARLAPHCRPGQTPPSASPWKLGSPAVGRQRVHREIIHCDLYHAFIFSVRVHAHKHMCAC